jgi:hypothetical protein
MNLVIVYIMAREPIARATPCTARIPKPVIMVEQTAAVSTTASAEIVRATPFIVKIRKPVMWVN